MSLPTDAGLFTSRFVTRGDQRLDHLILPLHKTWWSRPYEYAWASRFADGADTVLDAACGVEHPFKFFLLDRCREVHACDIDERILSRERTLRELRSVFGNDAVRRDTPPDALYHEPLGIRCFRLVLKKKGPAQAGGR